MWGPTRDYSTFVFVPQRRRWKVVRVIYYIVHAYIRQRSTRHDVTLTRLQACAALAHTLTYFSPVHVGHAATCDLHTTTTTDAQTKLLMLSSCIGSRRLRRRLRYRSWQSFACAIVEKSRPNASSMFESVARSCLFLLNVSGCILRIHRTNNLLTFCQTPFVLPQCVIAACEVKG